MTGFKRNIAGIPEAMAGESDHDDVPEEMDECPNSNADFTIAIDGFDSGVRNRLLTAGCTITDKIALCAKDARNHDQFVNCVAQLTSDLTSNGTISNNDASNIQARAEQANIPPPSPTSRHRY